MKREIALWAGILVGPVTWFLSMLANFALAPWACTLAWKPALFAVSILALLITAGSGLLSWAEWQRLGREEAGEAGTVVARSRALAIGGILLSGFTSLVIVAQFLPHIILGACQ